MHIFEIENYKNYNTLQYTKKYVLTMHIFEIENYKSLMKFYM